MSSPMLERGDLVPHFDVRTIRGEATSYSTIWQRRNLVLVTLPAVESADEAQYASQLDAREAAFGEHEATCVVTRDSVPGMRAPGVLVADRWGEIIHIVSNDDVRALPAVADLLDWIDYVRHRCPECEGESK